MKPFKILALGYHFGVSKPVWSDPTKKKGRRRKKLEQGEEEGGRDKARVAGAASAGLRKASVVLMPKPPEVVPGEGELSSPPPRLAPSAILAG